MGKWQMTIEYTPTTPVSTVCSEKTNAVGFQCSIVLRKQSSDVRAAFSRKSGNAGCHREASDSQS